MRGIGSHKDTLKGVAHDAARYLERNRYCYKHHVEHTGNNAYVLDFYTFLGEVETGKYYINKLLRYIVRSGDAYIFYPGIINKMNMSTNAIDCGSVVDAICRFLRFNGNAFSQAERSEILGALRPVVETYLASASAEKPVTNQRLWALTGLCAFAREAGEEEKYRPLARASIERAFSDMTEDGFFRYYPDAPRHGAPAAYDGITTFYQSRHIAFIRYALECLGLSPGPWEERLQSAERALLSMYTTQGVKDLRLECKRWYWQGKYEVASHGFDSYALSRSMLPESSDALHNVLCQVRRHFRDGYLHSSEDTQLDFQCPIFWTAHLAWLLRASEAERRFDAASGLRPFRFSLKGKEVFTHTASEGRVLINRRMGERNPSTGIISNGLPDEARWSLRFPRLPPSLSFSFRETANHIWYALRGGYVREALLRAVHFCREIAVMCLPRYSSAYGTVGGFAYETKEDVLLVRFEVRVASKYGTPGTFSRTGVASCPAEGNPGIELGK